MLDHRRKAARRSLDRQLRPLQAINPDAVPRSGWLRAIREAIGMSGQQFADRLGFAWQSMDDLEKSEAAGTISLTTLRRAAAALDCKVVYAVVPLTGTLEEMVETRAKQIAHAALARVDQTMRLEDQAVSADTLDERIDDYIAAHVRDSDLWTPRGP